VAQRREDAKVFKSFYLCLKLSLYLLCATSVKIFGIFLKLFPTGLPHFRRRVFVNFRPVRADKIRCVIASPARNFSEIV